MSKLRWASGRLAARPLALASAVLALTAAVAVAAPGDLDTSFDGDGKKTLDYGGGDVAQDVLVQADQKVVLAGTGNPNRDFVVTRLNPEGSPDTSFDGDGTMGITFADRAIGNAAALQPNRKIVVAGSTTIKIAVAGSTTMRSFVAVARLDPDGSLDTSFDGDGKKTIGYTGAADEARDVLVQPDEKIVLAGTGNPDRDLAVTRLNPNGSLDTSFDGNGTIGINFGGRDVGNAAALQPNGKVVVAGSTSIGSDVAIVRLNADGSPDKSFDGDGKQTIDYTGIGEARDVLVQPDNKIVLAGTGNPNGDFAVTRLNPDGSLDTSFDGDGTIGVSFGDVDVGNAAALQANGKIVVAGSTTVGPDDVAVVRLQPGGSLDSTFDGDGKQTLIVPGSAEAFGAALPANGRILVAGRAASDVFVARLEGDPVGSGGGLGGGPGGTRGVPRCAGKRGTVVGTSRRDRLRGTPRADVIVSLGGHDTIKGGRGNDLICAGTGNDSVAGEAGNDRVYGQSGKDKLTGGFGNDRIDGGASNDSIFGQSGKDSLTGGSGNDRIEGGPNKDRINGGAGRDKCAGGTGRDRVRRSLHASTSTCRG